MFSYFYISCHHGVCLYTFKTFLASLMPGNILQHALTSDWFLQWSLSIIPLLDLSVCPRLQSHGSCPQICALNHAFTSAWSVLLPSTHSFHFMKTYSFCIPCGATQNGRVMVESSDRMWSTGERNGKPLQCSCLENPMNSMRRQMIGYWKRNSPGR